MPDNKIKIKTKFSIAPSTNKSLNIGTNSGLNTTRMKRIRRGDSSTKSNFFRIDNNNLFPKEPNLGMISSNLFTNNQRKLSFSKQKIYDSMHFKP